MRRWQYVVALFSGALFALGLGLSGMTQPRKVLAFLDVFGDWDPALLFVMIGAIAVHVTFARRATQPDAQPLLADRYELPSRTEIDAPLVGGAVLFGLGWGIAGFCPGPAVVSLVALSAETWLFVGAMGVGMLLHTVLGRLRRASGSPHSVAAGARSTSSE